MVKPLPRLQLQGFNNLTKALSFNIYDICYAVSEEQRQRYIEYIDEAYDSDRLTKILTDVADIYDLDFERVRQFEGFAEVSVNNLAQAIEASKARPLANLLVGLSVRHLGGTGSRLLATPLLP